MLGWKTHPIFPYKVPPILQILIAFLLAAEFLLFCFAWCVFLKKQGYRTSAAASLGILLGMTCLSVVFQAAFLLRIPALAVATEAVALVFSLWYCSQNKPSLYQIWEAVRGMFLRHRWVLGILGGVIVYLFAQAMLLYPNNIDSLIYHLPRVLLFQQENTLFLQSTHMHGIVIFPMGNDILYHHFLRFHLTRGLAFFGFLAYAGVILASYAFARDHFQEKVALACAAIVAGLPELVFMSTTPKNDIPVCFVGVVVLMLLARLYKSFHPRDFGFTLLFLAFGVSAKTTTIAFALPFCLFLLLLLLWKKPLFALLSAYRRYWHCTAVALVVMAILSQAWLFLDNEKNWGGWSGPTPFKASGTHKDGMVGGVANAFRYGLEMTQIPGQFDANVAELAGFRPTELLQGIYTQWIEPVFGNAGMAPNRNFQVRWEQNEDNWYGPFGVLIMLGILWQLARGGVVTRSVAAILLMFFCVLCLKMGWTENKERFFALFFAGGAFCLAPFLARFPRQTIPLVIGLSLYYQAQAATYNITKPLLAYESLRVDNVIRDSILNGNNVWAKTGFGERNYWGNQVDELREAMPDTGKVALLGGTSVRLFPLMVGKPGLSFVGVTCPKGDLATNNSSNPLAGGRNFDLQGFDYLLLMRMNHAVPEGEWTDTLQLHGTEVGLAGKELKFKKVWGHSVSSEPKPYALFEISER